MKLIRPRYDPETGNFLRLYETVGFIIVRGDSDKGFSTTVSKNKSQVFHIRTAKEKY